MSGDTEKKTEGCGCGGGCCGGTGKPCGLAGKIGAVVFILLLVAAALLVIRGMM